MYRIEWMRTAHEDLARVYPSSDAELDGRIKSALLFAEESLLVNPLSEGESRADQDRIAFFSPLALGIFRCA